jgi:hypothetical protein
LAQSDQEKDLMNWKQRSATARSQHLGLLAIGFGVALVLGLLYVEGGSRRRAVIASAEPLQPARDVLSPVPLSVDVPSDGARVVAVAETALETSPSKFESAPVHAAGAQTLDEKYAGASFEQLLGAESVLKDRVDTERGRIGKELIANNRLTLVTPQTEDGAGDSRSANADGSPTSCVFKVDEHGVGWKATITREEYPDFKAMESEWWWVACKVHSIKNAKTQAKG